MKLESKKQIAGLTFLLAVTYMISYMTRINFGAIISEMETATAISRKLLSLAITGSFITYGAGQIVSGIIGDRADPKKLVALGLTVTALMNLLIPVCRSPYQMLGVWCVNGFAQSFLWPPLTRMLAALLHKRDYDAAITKVAWGSSFGTIAVYLIAPVLLSGFGWRSVFLFSAGCALVLLPFWLRYSYTLPPEKEADHQSGNTARTPLLTPLMLAIMAAIILQGMLRDGVTTWMPTYISDTYRLGNEISILSGVVLPVFSILCFQAASKLYARKLTNPVSCAAVFFAIGTAAALGLLLGTGKSAFLSVFFSAVLTGCMYGVNLMLNCMIPAFFRKSGHVSAVSGMLNSCTYVGSALSTYGIALFSEAKGWQFTLGLWLLAAILGAVLCLVCARPWSRKYNA